MGKGAYLPYMFGFLGVNGRQIYPFYSFTPPSKHGPGLLFASVYRVWVHMSPGVVFGMGIVSGSQQSGVVGPAYRSLPLP